MANMKMVSKEEALSVACERCASFIKTHEKVVGTPAYIDKSLDCKKCNLQFDMMGDKIAVIWKCV